MTREEAIERLKTDIYEYADFKENPNENEFWMAFDMAIETLKQEPKIGHWIYDDEHSDWSDVTYKCSCCKRAISVPYEVRNEVYRDYPFCHCGAKMTEPIESDTE